MGSMSARQHMKHGTQNSTRRIRRSNPTQRLTWIDGGRGWSRSRSAHTVRFVRVVRTSRSSSSSPCLPANSRPGAPGRSDALYQSSSHGAGNQGHPPQQTRRRTRLGCWLRPTAKTSQARTQHRTGTLPTQTRLRRTWCRRTAASTSSLSRGSAILRRSGRRC